MFNFFKNTQLENEIARLNREIDNRDRQIERMQLEKIDATKADVNSSTFDIDWNKMDAFSIERMGDNMSAYTVIGYYMQNDAGYKEVHEWKFYCSQEQHNTLAKDFRNGIAKKADSALREYSTST